MTYCGSWILVNSYPFSAARVINVIRRSGSSPHRNWQYCTKKIKLKKKKSFFRTSRDYLCSEFCVFEAILGDFPDTKYRELLGPGPVHSYLLCTVSSPQLFIGFIDQMNYYAYGVVLCNVSSSPITILRSTNNLLPSRSLFLLSVFHFLSTVFTRTRLV